MINFWFLLFPFHLNLSDSYPRNLNRSGDGTARIWEVPTIPGQNTSEAVILRHSVEKNESGRDVTTLDWDVCTKKELI